MPGMGRKEDYVIPKYLVGVREVHISYREIEANSPEEAIKKADDVVTEVFREYSHDLSEELWTVEEIKSKEPKAK